MPSPLATDRHRVRAQYVSVVAQFVGVICVVQPGTGAFSPWSLAVVLGYVFFDEIPNTLTAIGCTIILASGVYAIRLEQAAKRISTDPAFTTPPS